MFPRDLSGYAGHRKIQSDDDDNNGNLLGEQRAARFPFFPFCFFETGSDCLRQGQAGAQCNHDSLQPLPPWLK